MRAANIREQGYSLAELLVVVAIIALVAGLAIPAIGGIGGLLANDPDLAARELYSVLRAARIYSTTYRVDTAVFYVLNTRVDSTDESTVRIIEGFGMARRMTTDEVAPYVADNVFAPGDASRAFKMVLKPEAQTRRLPEEACILAIDTDFDSLVQPAIDGTGSHPQEGLKKIFVIGEDHRVIAPFVDADPGDSYPNLFPAHIFVPAGFMANPDLESGTLPVARYVINIGVPPDASLEERYVIVPNNPDGNTPVRSAPVQIELFRTTGRVRIL